LTYKPSKVLIIGSGNVILEGTPCSPYKTLAGESDRRIRRGGYKNPTPPDALSRLHRDSSMTMKVTKEHKF
jgi:hypothetical protein